MRIAELWWSRKKSKAYTILSFPRKRESIISNTYKFLDSRFRGNDNYLRSHQL